MRASCGHCSLSLQKTLKIQDVGLVPMGGVMPGAVPAAAAQEVSPGQKEAFLWCLVRLWPHVPWFGISGSAAAVIVCSLHTCAGLLQPPGTYPLPWMYKSLHVEAMFLMEGNRH